MPKTRLQRFARSTLAALCLSAMTGAGAASGGAFTRGCAARDMQVLRMIEEREAAQAVPVERLSDAMLTMLHARVVCHEGYVMDALAIYDGIAESITPNRVLSGRPQITENPDDAIVAPAGRVSHAQ